MEEPNGSIHIPLLQQEPERKKRVYLKNNFFDRFLMLWVGKIITIGKKKPFQQDMHWDLGEKESSAFIVGDLSKTYEKVKDKRNPLLRALAKRNYGMFFHAMFYSLLGGLLEYAGPLLLKYIINYMTEPEKNLRTGILLVLGIIFSRIFVSIFSARAQLLLTVLGINTSNAVNGLVYEKGLRFSLIRSAEHSLGSLVNHIQVDSQKLYYLGLALGGVLILPLLIGVGIYFMYAAVGLSFFSGIAVIIIMGFVNYVVGKKFFNAQKAVMRRKDERMKTTTEILNGIKYIKMSGWEEAFLDKILKSREQELGWLKRQYLCTCFSIFFLWLTPMLITTAVFATYIFTGNDMDAKAAFTLVSTLMILQQPLRALPYTITLSLESKVAIDRVTKFLQAEDVQLGFIKKGRAEDSDTAIKVKNGNFFWMTEEEKKVKKANEREKEEEEKQEKLGKGKQYRKEKAKREKAEKKKKRKEEKMKKKENKRKSKIVHKNDSTTLENESIIISSQKQGINLEAPPADVEGSDTSSEKHQVKLVTENINLEIKKGSFVAILGDVGSGKSSILFSIVGEMKYDPANPPEVEINGSVSYVSQQPWIMNATVKNNILFGGEFNSHRYHDAIKYSCLDSDLEILIHKDETEIGEKGVNLSGGQKARVSLARALYRQSDIYLLDDPLSAVDAHVGNFILKECFMGYIKHKTRVLVTHKFESLKYVDQIYIFKEGKIVEQGTLESLKDSPIFQEVKQKYRVQGNKDESEGEEEEEKSGDSDDEVLFKSNQVEENRPESLDQIQPTALPTEEGTSSSTSLKEKPGEKVKDAVDEQEEKKLQERLMLDEDRETGVVGWRVWKSYFNYYGGWFYFTLVFLVMLTWISLQTASNFWLSYWSDSGDSSGHSKEFFFEIYAALGLSYAFFCFIRTGMLFIQSIRCSRGIHKDMLTKIVRAPVNLFFDRVPTGRLLNRLSKDLTVLDSYIATSFGYMLVTIFSLFSDIFVCLIVGTAWVFPLVILFFFVSYKLQRSYMRVNREVVRLESISKSPIVSFFSESLAGVTSIRAYEEEAKFKKRFHDLQDANIKNLILQGGLYNWFNLRVTFCTIFVIAPSVAVPLLLNTGNTLASGMVGLLITYVIQINDDIISFLWALSNFETKLISLERCRAFTLIESEALAKTKDRAAIENLTEKWPQEGNIEFKDYTVKYRPNLPEVVKNLSVSVQSREKIGVVGRTGSGKSTLFLSILRIIEPLHGKILVDGVDISKLGLDDLRRKITIIPQDPMLFKGSIRENLDLLNKYTDEQLWQSLERVCMKTKFEEDNGLRTEIKEGGENLSAGEKQLICIGRAILAQSKIILIDEATSNIDPNTEQTILDTIYNSFKDCTVITVAHRLKTIINSDKILVMGDGQLLEFDNPQTLIDDHSTHFHKLWMEHEHGHTDIKSH